MIGRGMELELASGTSDFAKASAEAKAMADKPTDKLALRVEGTAGHPV
jgi:hypothetical protein